MIIICLFLSMIIKNQFFYALDNSGKFGMSSGMFTINDNGITEMNVKMYDTK